MSEEQNASPKKFELSPSLAIILSGFLIAGSIVFVNLHPAAAEITAGAAQAAPQKADIRLPSAQSDHWQGSPSAPIVLVEYSDFQCPFCSMIYPTLKKIVDESNGQIAWAYREFPLSSIHPQAEPAANAAECIAEQLGNEGFWKFADEVFSNQSAIEPQYYAGLAKQFGADPAKFVQCVSSKKYQSKIDADTAEAQSTGANGTPYTVVVNTKTGKAVPVSGALPYEQIMAVIKTVQ